MSHIKKLENEIKQFIIRYVKEYDIQYNMYYFYCTRSNLQTQLYSDILSYINVLTLKDDIYNDIIELICKTGNIELKTLIEDINAYIKYDFINFNYLENKKDVISYMKFKLTNKNLLSNPVDGMFWWQATNTGHDKYSSINEKIKKDLNFFCDLRTFVEDTVSKFLKFHFN